MKLLELTVINVTIFLVVHGVKILFLVSMLPFPLVSGLTHAQTVEFTDTVILAKIHQVVLGVKMENVEETLTPMDVSFPTLAIPIAKVIQIVQLAMLSLDVDGVTNLFLVSMLTDPLVCWLTLARMPTLKRVDLMEVLLLEECS